MRTIRLVTGVLAVALSGEACGSTDPEPDRDLGRAASAAKSPQTFILGSDIFNGFAFSTPLPVPGNGINTVLGNQALNLRMCEFWAKVLPEGTFTEGVQPKTRVWGYIVGNTCPANGDDALPRDTYIGPAIVSQRPGPGGVGKPGSSTDITWINELGTAELGRPDTTQVQAYRFSTDQTLHWADPLHPNEANLCYETVAQTGDPPASGSECAQNYAGTIPGVPHLHGAEVPANIDGGPEQWFTSDGAHQGPAYYTFAGAPQNGNRALFKYPNTQQSAPLWFHDHTLGTTRLNVYAGLAGAYLLEDAGIIPKTVTTSAGTKGTCNNDCLPANLPVLGAAVPIVIQDRIFDTNGQLFFTADSAGLMPGDPPWNPNPQHPYWAPEFFGDTILVNGRAWPFLDVDAKRMQFLFLDGSNARAYTLSFQSPLNGLNVPPMYVIATDGGYLDEPAPVNKGTGITIMPGERYVVIIDFGGFEGQNFILTNTAAAPLPGGPAPTPTDPLGQIIKFKVRRGSAPPGGDKSYNPAAANAPPLRPGKSAIVRLADPDTGTVVVNTQKIRQLTLNEVLINDGGITTIDPVTGFMNTPFTGGPFEVLVNNTTYEGTARPDFVPITISRPGETVTKFISELPQEGDTEEWDIVNLTMDAHPIHLHLVQFQLVNRQAFNVDGYLIRYNDAFLPDHTFMPGNGPPLSYTPSAASGFTFGGNPDVTPDLIANTLTLPASYEAGWKDTVIMPPGMVTRIVARWAPTDLKPSPAPKPPGYLHFPFDPSDNRGYVWHCHIIDHEDNDMMRPYNVPLNPTAPPPHARPLAVGKQY